MAWLALRNLLLFSHYEYVVLLWFHTKASTWTTSWFLAKGFQYACDLLDISVLFWVMKLSEVHVWRIVLVMYLSLHRPHCKGNSWPSTSYYFLWHIAQEEDNSTVIGSSSMNVPEGGVWFTLTGSVPMQYATSVVGCVKIWKFKNIW